MITYFLNWMGPINSEWIEEHGEGWSAGRLDVDGLDENEFYHGSTEYSVAPMKSEDWGRLSDWLWDYDSFTQLTLEEIVTEFEKTNPKIQWLEEKTV